MSMLQELIDGLTASKKYKDILFNANGYFFMIDDKGIMIRMDPGFAYEDVYYVTTATKEKLDKYFSENNLKTSDFPDAKEFGNHYRYENSSFERLLDKRILCGTDAEKEFIKRFLKTGDKVTGLFKAVNMINHNLKLERWYMDFDGEYVDVIDSMREENEYLDEKKLRRREKERWISALKNIEDYVYVGGRRV